MPAGGPALWRGPALKADAWRSELGASEFLCRAIRYGIRDMPTVPFTEGRVLGEIPQSEKDKLFAREDLRSGCQSGVYEEISPLEAREIARSGKMISSAFVVWQGEGEDRKGRFVVNLKQQSQHWPKGSVKMETIPSFALDLQKDDTLMSWDIKSGYRHMYLHPDMRDFFVFRFDGRFYRCIALPFGWGRSALWFTKLMRPIVQHLRVKKTYRVLPYIDDFAAAPSPHGTAATTEDCTAAGIYLDGLFARIGIVRHPDKGCWAGTRHLEHLGMLIDTEKMRVFVTDKKIERVRALAKKILVLAQRNRRLVSLDLLRHFCGVCVSLSLALPLARFYTRSIYFDMSLAEKKTAENQREDCLFPGEPGRHDAKLERQREASTSEASSSETRRGNFAESPPGEPRPASAGYENAECRPGETRWASAEYEEAENESEEFSGYSGARAPTRRRVRLCRQSLKDLRHWRSLARGEGRELQPSAAALTMHSDAADVGYGGTLGMDERAGSQGLWEGQGFWTQADRAESITLRELRAVRLLLHRHFAEYVSRPDVTKILLHEDNQAVVFILNAMVSASAPMMTELRKLEVLMRALGVRVDARWLPSAVNRFADALSRTWDPGDARATAELVQSVASEYRLDHVAFRERPLGETMVARHKYLVTQMEEDWGDGRSRLWNPPFDMLPLVVQKIEAEGGKGVVIAPHWPAQAWHARLQSISKQLTLLAPGSRTMPLLESDGRLNSEWSVLLAEVN